jgi:flagellar motor protein MotB
MVLGGCGKAKQSKLALSENSELRDRNAQLEAALQEAHNRNSSLEEENQRLASSGGATGFEGIAGVAARRGQGGEVIVSVAGDVLFDSGQITLKSTATRSLDQVASVMKGQYQTNTVRIEGYTDSDPIKKSPWKTNERLSAERALAVESYLEGRGVDKERMYSAAFGPANPRASKQASRRVEIVILAGVQP